MAIFQEDALQPVVLNLTTQAIYSTTIPTLIPAAAATDVLLITGSATKLVRVLTIELFMMQTTAGISSWLLIRRSTDDTGASIALTPRNHDINDPAATAVIREYQANPTLGTSVGIVSRSQILHASATSTIQPGYTFDFINSGFDKGIVLRGVSDILVLNFNGAAVPAGLQVFGTITHSEE